MKKRFQRILAITLCLLQIVGFPAQAARPSSSKPTVIFLPLKNGNDAKVDSIVDELTQSILERFKDSLNVIDANTVTQNLHIAPILDDESQEYAEALSRVQKAREAYVIGGNADVALSDLDEAARFILEKVPATQGSSKLLITIQLTHSWILNKTGKALEAKSVLRNLFKIVPREKINVTSFHRDFQTFVKGVEIQSEEAAGTINLKTSPASVDVYVEGLFVGASPLSLHLPEGKYDLSFSANGRKGVRKKISVGEKEKFVSINLPWNKNTARDESLPMNFPSISNAGTTISNLSSANQIAAKVQAQKSVIFEMRREGRGYRVAAKVFDHGYNQPFRNIVYKKSITNIRKQAPHLVDYFVSELHPYLTNEPTKLWKRDFDIDVTVDQRIAMRPSKPLYRKPAFWAVVGGVVVTGVALGLALSSGGGSNAPGSGSVTVDFGGFQGAVRP